MLWHPRNHVLEFYLKSETWKLLSKSKTSEIYQNKQDEACFLIIDNSQGWIIAYERYESQRRGLSNSDWINFTELFWH